MKRLVENLFHLIALYHLILILSYFNKLFLFFIDITNETHLIEVPKVYTSNEWRIFQNSASLERHWFITSSRKTDKSILYVYVKITGCNGHILRADDPRVPLSMIIVLESLFIKFYR